MSEGWIVVTIGAGWAALGVVLAVVMGRRGHNAFGWWVIGTVLGPLAVVLAVDAAHREPHAKREVLDPGVPGPGPVDILAGVDGSPESIAALHAAMALFESRIGRLTLAGVVDYDAGLDPRPHEQERLLRAQLQEEARALTSEVHYELSAAPLARRSPEVVVLSGRPAEVLASTAVEDGYDVLVIGSRGRGLRPLGRVASALARGSKVPVLMLGQA